MGLGLTRSGVVKAEEESGVIKGGDIAFPCRLHCLFCSLKEDGDGQRG